MDSILRDCDLFLAITGPHWFRTVAESPCSHWLPKMIHLDLAIDRKDFPSLKTSFGAAGKRRVLYIGHTSRGKNTAYLTEIAALLPDTEFAWIGKGVRPIHGLTAHGFVDYDSTAGKELLAGFDFFLTVGNADANPTTILEAMSWGMVPISVPRPFLATHPLRAATIASRASPTCRLATQQQPPPSFANFCWPTSRSCWRCSRRTGDCSTSTTTGIDSLLRSPTPSSPMRHLR